MNCPKCGKTVDVAHHQTLIFNGQVWCDQCHAYDRELLRLRQADDIRGWGQRICQAFGQAPVPIETFPAFIYVHYRKILVAEVNHRKRCIDLYTQGLSLATLCHELAHVFTAEDHTPHWARTFAELVAWVKAQLSPASR
jgi:hypothetical protein